ncbi:MAG: hypothetical protein KDA44_08250 [Planctomycetales bacterium]|nr:hypothetical protein [Planctomycetales bacterium]
MGPTPYLSAADSPFPVDGSNPRFFLEDFEDGLLDTSGVGLVGINRPPIFPPVAGGISGPGPETDSVDGDDGVVDGLGNDGSSLRQAMFLEEFEIFSTRLRFEFSEGELGFLPNAFGIVWTDGLRGTGIRLRAFSPAGLAVAEQLYVGFGDAAATGETTEDRFIGLVSPVGFAAVELSVSAVSSSVLPFPPPVVEFDHLQYGAIVPELPTVDLIAVGTLIASTVPWRSGAMLLGHKPRRRG